MHLQVGGDIPGKVQAVARGFAPPGEEHKIDIRIVKEKIEFQRPRSDSRFDPKSSLMPL